MSLLISIFSFELKRYLAYPFELILTIVQFFFKILFLIVFWGVVTKSSESNLDFIQLTSYFLIANGVSTITMAHDWQLGKYIRHRVKDGSIANLFIKPVDIIRFAYFSTVGSIGLSFALAIISIVVGITIQPPQSIVGALLFPIYLILAMILGFTFNLFEASLSFIFAETSGIKNAMRHVVSVFSGLLVPIYLFPEKIRVAVELSPFPFMIFAPTNALSQAVINTTVYKDLLVGISWSVLLLSLVLLLWKKVIRNFEAVGL